MKILKDPRKSVMFSRPEAVAAMKKLGKSQLRVPVEPQPRVVNVKGTRAIEWGPDGPDGGKVWWSPERRDISQLLGWNFCPYKQPYMALWAKEPWAMRTDSTPDTDHARRYLLYWHDYDFACKVLSEEHHPYDRWRSAHSMPYWASRFEFTALRVSMRRLHDMTVADAIAEGAIGPEPMTFFADKIWNAKYGHKPGLSASADPWVYVLDLLWMRTRPAMEADYGRQGKGSVAAGDSPPTDQERSAVSPTSA